MDTGRGNEANQEDDGEDKWEDRSGLQTPPSSQDATKTLISPPPEETLRMGSSRVSPLSLHSCTVQSDTF